MSDSGPIKMQVSKYVIPSSIHSVKITPSQLSGIAISYKKYLPFTRVSNLFELTTKRRSHFQGKNIFLLVFLGCACEYRFPFQLSSSSKLIL